MMLPSTLEELNNAMCSTEQMQGLTVYEHGIAVHHQYIKLLEGLQNGTCNDPVLKDVYEVLQYCLLDMKTMQRYQVYHDCGKPYCREVQDGKVHFPDHANVSADLWKTLFPKEVLISDLMRLDMMWHTISLSDADEFWEHPLAAALYFTAYAEILANCQMFGGEESTSFKIKRKKLQRCGKKLLK